MKRYVGLLRGINISGKNKISMPELKKGFEELGFAGKIIKRQVFKMRLRWEKTHESNMEFL